MVTKAQILKSSPLPRVLLEKEHTTPGKKGGLVVLPAPFHHQKHPCYSYNHFITVLQGLT